MKKRILITYATYGSGHLAVAKYIEDYFKKENQDFEILSVDLLKYSIPVIGEMSRIVSDTVVLKLPTFYDLTSVISNNKFTSAGVLGINMTMFDNKRLKKLIKDFCPDITISTHFYGSTLIARMNNQKTINSKLVTIVTDYKAHELWLKNHKSENAIIVPSIEAKKDMIKRCPEINKSVIKNFGIPIFNRMANNLDYDQLLKKFKITNSLPIITFFGGSSYSTSNSFSYFKRLVKNNPKANIFYITGNAKDLKEKAEVIVKKYNAKNIKILGYINNVPEYMTISDFIITKPGGIIVNECVYFGKPMLLINGNAGQEKDNYKYLVKKGFAIRANNLFAFTKHLEHLVNNKEIVNMMKNNILNYENKEAIQKLYKLVEKLLNTK